MTSARTAIVTGASSGIGLALTRMLNTRGYNVVAAARRLTQAATLTAGPTLALVDGDVASPAVAEILVETARQRFGGVDLLVNNAGTFAAKPFIDYSIDDFNQHLSTNLAGFFHVTQQALRAMRGRKSGHVVNITTSLADQPLATVPAAVPVLTKAGLNGVTKALAIELAADGIRVNAVAPGIVDTPMHQPQSHDFLRQLHPIARLATTSEIVDAVMFLESAAFVTGEVLHVDGGAHAGRW